MKSDVISRTFLIATTFLVLYTTWKLWILQTKYNGLLCENKALIKDYKPEYESIVKYLNKISDEWYPVKHAFSYMQTYDDLRTIYIVTKINADLMTQIANLNRLRNTLRLVPKIVWLLVEDTKIYRWKITKFIERSKFPQTFYLIHQISQNSTHKLRNTTNILYNYAFKWLIENKNDLDRNGVVFFAKVTNSFSISLFDDIRETMTVSVWPVAYVNKTFYQRPICKNNKVVDWYCEWNCTKEEYPIDISGFAIHLNLILENEHIINQNILHEGLSKFLSSLVKIDDLEPKGDNCSKINVWNLDTCNPFISYPHYKLKLRNMSYEGYMLNQI